MDRSPVSLRVLFGKEFLLNLYDGKYLVYAFLCVFLVVGSFVVNSSVFRIKQDNFTSLAGRFVPDERDLENGYWGFTHTGIHELLPPQKMQMVCNGLEKEFYKYVHINLQRVLPLLKKESIDYPDRSTIIRLDLVRITTLVLSLLVFIFSYGAIAQEREGGTLKLQLSYPVSRLRVIVMKMAAGYTGVILPLLFSFMAILLFVQFSPGLALGSGGTGMLLAVFALACLYLLIMYLLGLMVSALVRRSATAIIVLVGCWLLFMVVLHNMALVTMEKHYRPRTAAEMTEEFNLKLKQAYKETDDESMKRFGTTAYWRLPPDKITPAQKNDMLAYYLRLTHAASEHILQGYVRELKRSAAVLRTWSFLSPSLLFSNTAARLADTGIESRVRLYETVIRAQRDFLEFVTEDLDVLSKEGKEYGDGSHRIPIEKLARMVYPNASPSVLIAASIPELVVMVLLAGLFLLGGMYVFLRRDVI